MVKQADEKLAQQAARGKTFVDVDEPALEAEAELTSIPNKVFLEEAVRQ